HATGVGHASEPDAARQPYGAAHADALRHDERSACPLAAPSDGVFAFAKIPILPAEAASAELPATTRAPALQGGRPLARAAPDYFAPRFGFDFSKVRIHDGRCRRTPLGRTARGRGVHPRRSYRIRPRSLRAPYPPRAPPVGP